MACQYTRTLLSTVLLLGLVGGLYGNEPRLRDHIDEKLQAVWKQSKITPAAPASDSAFLRRVYLDLVGAVPTYDETVAFLDNKDPEKRTKLIDRLMADPRFAQHQADIWDMILFGRKPPGYNTDKRAGFQAWVCARASRRISPMMSGPASCSAPRATVSRTGLCTMCSIAMLLRTPSRRSVRHFSGSSFSVRCHDHPYETWKQVDFYGMAAFLARLDVVEMGKKGNETLYVIGEHDSGDIQFTGPAKDATPGKKGQPVKPKFLLGEVLAEPASPPTKRPPRFKPRQMPPKPKYSRKDQLANWITDAKNPFFARAIANRIWAQFMGRGIVHPVDNLSAANPPSMPDLLDRLSKELIAHKFDLQWFIKEIVNSRAYQLGGSGTGEPMPDWYQHARSRPLSAEELIEAWRIVTGYAAVEKANPRRNASTSRYRPLDGYLLHFFGSPNTGTGDFQGGLHEHLYMNNGPLSQIITTSKGSLAEIVGDSRQPVASHVERLFLQTLQRRPTPGEMEKFVAFLDNKGSVSDAIWVLITSSEFRFNH